MSWPSSLNWMTVMAFEELGGNVVFSATQSVTCVGRKFVQGSSPYCSMAKSASGRTFRP